MITAAKLPREHLQALLHEWQFRGFIHAAGDIHEEDEVCRRALVLHVPGLQGDACQPVLRLPGGLPHVHLDRERFAVHRVGIAVREIVDQFSSRTASAGGRDPVFRNRRTFAYEAVSTSIEKVESGTCVL